MLSVGCMLCCEVKLCVCAVEVKVEVDCYVYNIQLRGGAGSEWRVYKLL